MRLVYEPLTDIPQNFTEVEYLQSSGTQYIDTGWSPVSNDLRVNFRTKSMSSPAATAICGAEDRNVIPRWVFIMYGQSTDNTKTFPLTGDWNNNDQGFTFTSGSVLEIDWTTSSTSTTITDSVSGTTYTKTFGSTINYSNNTITLKLFQNADNQKSSIQINYYKIWDGGVLVRDFVPCLDNNNIPCMYDRVEGKAYYNAGTGSFTYGRKIIPVEYLESTGTQYINTGVNANSNPKYELKFVISYTNPSSPSPQYTGADYGGTFGVVNGKWQWSNNVPVTANQFYEIDYINQNGSRGAYVNGTDYYQGSNFASLGYRCLLFTSGQDSSGTTKTNLFSAKMKSCSIALSDTIVRDFIPCKDENNVGFMFDRVTHTAYLNAGTGSFITGSVKPKKKLRLIRESKRRLPKNFREVEYIQSSGTQYINTGYKFTSNMRFKINHIPTGSISDNYFTGHYASDNKVFLGGFYQNKCIWGIGKLQENTINASANQRFVVDMTYTSNSSANTSSVSGTINGQSVSLTSTALQDFVYGLNILAFARNNNGSVGHYLSCKLYSFQIYNSNTLVRDFIPCLDASNVPCMYDLVEGKAYYNAGTGSFTYGHTITPVEYLESTGTQYIDTGIIGNQNTKLQIRIQPTALYNPNQQSCQMIAGGYLTNSSAITLQPTSQPQSTSGAINNRFGNLVISHLYVSDLLITPHTYTISKTGINVDDVLYSFSGTLSNFTSNKIYLMQANMESAANVNKNKVYYSKIWDNDVLVRDYIPVKDENNVGYMFDKVTHSLYANSGSGAFVVGNEIKQDITRFVKDDVPNIYRKVSYLESSGTQYIDTGVREDTTCIIDMQATQTTNTTQVVLANTLEGTRTKWFGTAGTTNYYSVGGSNGVSSVSATTRKECVVTFTNMYSTTSSSVSFYFKDDQANVYIRSDTVSGGITLTNICVGSRVSLYPSYVKLFGLKIYNTSNVLLRDYVPVVRKSDNKPGMYDRVTKQFFTNAGTGEFIIPT